MCFVLWYIPDAGTPSTNVLSPNLDLKLGIRSKAGIFLYGQRWMGDRERDWGNDQEIECQENETLIRRSK